MTHDDHRQRRTYRRADGVLAREGPFGVVVLPPAAPNPSTLAGTAPAVWAALAEPRDLGALTTELAGRFGAEPARVRHDLVPLLDELVRIGAVQEETP
jgi:hypothetical protein